MGRHAQFKGETRQTPGQAASWARKRRRQAEKQTQLEAEATLRGVSVTVVERIMAKEARDQIEVAEKIARERGARLLQREMEERRRVRYGDSYWGY